MRTSCPAGLTSTLYFCILKTIVSIILYTNLRDYKPVIARLQLSGDSTLVANSLDTFVFLMKNLIFTQ